MSSKAIGVARVDSLRRAAAALGAWAAAGVCFAAGPVTTINVTGIDSWDLKGAPGNPVLSITFPAGSVITSVGWNVTLTAYSPSWLSEMSVQFRDSPATQSVHLRPGAGSNFSGQASFSSGGLIPLSALGVPNLVLPNGILELEFYETFDDFAGAADGVWSGTLLAREKAMSELYFEVIPSPGAAWTLGVAGIACARRRRGV